MLSRDYRSAARGALRGYWGVSILVSFVASLLGANGGAFSGSSSGSNSANTQGAGPSDVIPVDAIPPAVLTVVAVLLSLLLLLALVSLIVGGAVKLGLVSYNIDLVTKRKTPVFSTLFSRFNIFGQAFLLNLMISIFTALWSLLFIIPGIIAALRYAMAPYILSENPGMGAMEAISRSKEMMNGNKWRLFKLRFSFIGWALLTILTLGIGFLWLAPYINAAEAAFFLDVSGKGVPNPESIPIGPDIP